MMDRLGIGGSCHWCTEGIFRSVLGVVNVQQGWIAATPPHDRLSEAILIDYGTDVVSLQTLVAIHLHSHSATKEHSMREKYRSAFYVFGEEQKKWTERAISAAQVDFEEAIVTQVLGFHRFESSRQELLDYYHKDPGRPFCATYISPKLRELMRRFPTAMADEKVAHLWNEDDRSILS